MSTTAAEDLAGAAHLHRRTSLAMNADRVDDLAGLGWENAVARVLDVEPGGGEPPTADRWEAVGWWIDRMQDPDGGLAESMAWFWHGILTTNLNTTGDRFVADQMQILRRGCLGNYRDLLMGFVTSGALLDYLNAAGSEASNPNENLARELMELFTTGRGHYTQDDVRSAARALAGWNTDDNGNVTWERERAFVAPLLIFGTQADWDTESLVNHLCDHPATARHIGSKVWAHFIGRAPDAEVADELGRWWASRQLEIRPLVERILMSEEFRASRLQRPRSGLEWLIAAGTATGVRIEEPWWAERVGQMPYMPPNVGGWPGGNRWLDAGSLLSRIHSSWELSHHHDMPVSSTAAIFRAMCLPDASSSSRTALDTVRLPDDSDHEWAAAQRWRLALNCPEFHLS